MKYIDAGKLIAEIDDRLHCNGAFDEVGDYEWHYDQGMVDAYNHIKEFITSLQQEQPELDLEKEANECWDYVFSAIGWDENSLMTMNHKEFLAFARHFYELGLNARKEE